MSTPGSTRDLPFVDASTAHERGLVTAQEISRRFRLPPSTLRGLARRGFPDPLAHLDLPGRPGRPPLLYLLTQVVDFVADS